MVFTDFPRTESKFHAHFRSDKTGAAAGLIRHAVRILVKLYLSKMGIIFDSFLNLCLPRITDSRYLYICFHAAEGVHHAS